MSQIHTNTPRTRGEYDAPDMSPVTPAEDHRTVLVNEISWGAVLAGVVLMLVTQLILNMLGVGVGSAMFDPATGDSPASSSFSIGAAAWWTLAGVLAALIGGFAAGRLAGKPKESTAGWHGLTSWALATLVIFYLLTSTMGGILGGAYHTLTNAMGNVATAVGSTAKTAAQVAAPNIAQVTDPFSSIEQALKGDAGGSGANDPSALRESAVSAMRALVSGNQQQVQEARERASQAIARSQNVPMEQAQTQVQQYEQQFREKAEQVKQQARQAADTAAKAVSMAALFAALGLLLGAAAAWFGGRWGAVDPTITAGANLGRVESGPLAPSHPTGTERTRTQARTSS